MATRLEGGCGPYRPARVDALPDGPGGLPTQFGGMCAVLAWATPPRTAVRRKCRRASPGLFSGLRGSLCRGSRRLRASVLSRCAPSATGNCSLLRRKYRWTASSLFFGLRSSLLPCSRALHASILPHFRAKRKRGDSPRSFRAIYFASAVASTLPNSWPL